MDRRGETLTGLAAMLPGYYMVKRAFRCEESSKAPIAERILSFARQQKAKVITLDGVKFVYPDHSWILLRPSGTEPFFRCYAEAGTAKEAEGLARSGVRLLHEASSHVKKTAR